jgi:hypothetical protein
MLRCVRTRSVLLGLLLSTAACDLQCRLDSEHSTELEIAVESKAEGERKVEVEARAEVEVERRAVAVEVERTVCDELDFEVERIVLVPADPPFHDHPSERVSIRITNNAAQAVKVDSGIEATFLDDRRTVVAADLHQSDWFMPLRLPANSAAVVQILVPQHAGTALRSVEVEAEPEDRPFSECKVVDDLLGKMPAESPPPSG